MLGRAENNIPNIITKDKVYKLNNIRLHETVDSTTIYVCDIMNDVGQLDHLNVAHFHILDGLEVQIFFSAQEIGLI